MTESKKKQGKLHYGWVIAVCCILFVCGSSLVSTGMSTNLNAMRQHLGFTNTQTSMVLTLRSIVGFIAAVFSARYYEKLGLRNGICLAMLSGVLAFLLFIIGGKNIYIVYIGGAVSGVCYTFGMMLPASMLIKNWFNKSRGFALAIASCGTAAVSVIFAPLTQSMVDNHGIMSAFIMEGGYLLLMAVLLFFLIKDRPEMMGLEPYGGKDWVPETKGREPKEATSLTRGWYYAYIFAIVLIGIVASPANANHTNNFVTAGLKPMDVAKAISLYGILVTVSKILFGKAVDRVGTFATTMIYGLNFVIALSLEACVNFNPRNWFMILSLAIYAFGTLVTSLGYPNWTVDLDSSHYNKTLSRCQTGYQFGAIIGSYVPGVIADATGSYAGAYFFFAACIAIAVIIVAGAYNSQKKK